MPRFFHRLKYRIKNGITRKNDKDVPLAPGRVIAAQNRKP
jgi:hypothetical protein